MPAPTPPKRRPFTAALIIASSDSGAGAGLQADLKTLAAHGVFGFCALSAVTAQNSVAVTAVECLRPEVVTAQLAAVADDFQIAAVKIGLLGNAANAKAVARFLAARLPDIPVVLDPVMVSASGHAFLPDEAVEALKTLMPLAAVITPNLPEAETLAGRAIAGDREREAAARLLLAGTGAGNVLIKADTAGERRPTTSWPARPEKCGFEGRGWKRTTTTALAAPCPRLSAPAWPRADLCPRPSVWPKIMLRRDSATVCAWGPAPDLCTTSTSFIAMPEPALLRKAPAGRLIPAGS